VRRLSLALVAAALAMPGMGIADPLPQQGRGGNLGSASSSGAPSQEPCTSSCAGSGARTPSGAAEPEENVHLANYILPALLGSLVVLVPIVITRQRNGRLQARASSRRAEIRLVASTGESDDKRRQSR
jgi:hypothetical protein